MSLGDSSKPCTIVLHESTASQECVLCGKDVLPTGALGYLQAGGAKKLVIAPQGTAHNPEEVSIHVSIARVFGFENRTKATVQLIEDSDDAVATHIELLFRDQHLSRSDMWRIKAKVDRSVLYEGQKLEYMGSVVADVEAIYIAGERVGSAYVLHPRTKLIFRSGSARFTFLIQISKEMLENWIEGDLMWERLVNGLLPTLFRRWDALKVRHHFSVILFGRSPQAQSVSNDTRDNEKHSAAKALAGKDFYHVLETDVNSADWRILVRKLKQAFNKLEFPRQVCIAKRGNMLHAIHLAAMDFARDNVDLRLTTTGTSIVAITAGSGMFEAEHDLLKRTTGLLMGNSIGVDVVSLATKPLHPVPLFHYTREGVDEYALPHWIDMSYWHSDDTQFRSSWLMPAALEPVQDIAITLLTKNSASKPASNSMFMDEKDDDIFSHAICTNISTLPDNNATKIEGINTASNVIPTLDPATKSIIEREPSSRSASSSYHEHISDSERFVTDESLSKSSVKSTAPRRMNTAAALTAGSAGTSFRPNANTVRKISLGPKGLAPQRDVASTTISVENVQHERDLVQLPSQPSAFKTTGLAKQIRESLARKTSQSSLVTKIGLERVPETAPPSRPIRILQTREEDDPGSREETASIIDIAELARRDDQSLSATPKGKHDSLPLQGMNTLEDNHGSISPWLTLLNPCNPRRDNMRIASEYRQWQHVFTRTVTAEDFKWESMCTPAILPLMTEYRISSAALEKHFNKSIRRIVAKGVSQEGSNHARRLLFELVGVRLAAGFQIVPRRSVGKSQTSLRDMEHALMFLDGNYHDLFCLSEFEVQIIEYERHREQGQGQIAAPEIPLEYDAIIRPAATKKSSEIHLFLAGELPHNDWSALDEQSVNPAALAETQGNVVIRLVLIPVHLAKSEQNQANFKELTDDERRIEGIQKITRLWQRHRYIPEADQRNHKSMVRSKTTSSIERDPNPLAIEYYTRDPSLVVKSQGPMLADYLAEIEHLVPLSGTSDVYHTSDFDVAKLAKHLQEPPPEGIELKDRWWLTKMHLRCFRGDEMTNWLLRVFKDLRTREDAVQLGSQLMDLGIFAHVRNKHDFKDGHYFYQIRSAYRTSDYPDSAGMFGKAIGRSVPPNHGPEYIQSPSARPVRDIFEAATKNSSTPLVTPVDRPEILLSQMMQYNVDSGRNSSTLEVVNLHYDLIHNPENCYHIQLDWTSTTAKLVRESINRWISVVESHGLKLVQLPTYEAVRLQEKHPFDQPIAVRLAVSPPSYTPSTPHLEPQLASPRQLQDTDRYHKALLRKLGYVLDFEAARNFPSRLQARYSWGAPNYKFTQFVHTSGLVLVQISNNHYGDFMVIQNRLAMHATTITSRKMEEPSASDTIKQFIHFCRDEKALKAFYTENSPGSALASSPLVNGALTADGEIPPFQLLSDVASKQQR